jgi:choline dehydrogenase-like flavoprotein
MGVCLRPPGGNEHLGDQAGEVYAAVIRSAGGVYEGSAKKPLMPGWSLHETRTCRMGNDPKHAVTNRFGQTHDVSNLYMCDASVFLNCTDKTTTISIMAFTLRTCEHLIENFSKGVHKRA